MHSNLALNCIHSGEIASQAVIRTVCYFAESPRLGIVRATTSKATVVV